MGSDVKIPPDARDYRIMDRKVVNALLDDELQETQPVRSGADDSQTLQQAELPILTNVACENAYDSNVSPGDWISANVWIRFARKL